MTRHFCKPSQQRDAAAAASRSSSSWDGRNGSEVSVRRPVCSDAPTAHARNQRDDATLSKRPTHHLFGCVFLTHRPHPRSRSVVAVDIVGAGAERAVEVGDEDCTPPRNSNSGCTRSNSGCTSSRKTLAPAQTNPNEQRGRNEV